MPLSKIFLPLEAVEGRPAMARYSEEDLRRQAEAALNSELEQRHRQGLPVNELDWQRRQAELEQRRAHLSAIRATQRALKLPELLQHPRAVLLGDPGSGKTTITEYVAYALAAGEPRYIPEAVQKRVPILVRLANYARAYERNPSLHLIDYIAQQLVQKTHIGPFLRATIEAGQALVMLDGLDEATDPTLRERVTERIRDLVAGYGQNHFLVTSRIIGYDVSPLTSDFQHATLRDLGPEEQQNFVRLWYDAISTASDQTGHLPSADDLVAALHERPQISRIAANPLLLTIVVLMHHTGTKLPNQRVQVYQNATVTLIENWTRRRGVELDAVEVIAILAPIAHQILASSVGGVIAQRELQPLFYAGLARERGCDEKAARRLGDELLQNLNEQSGLFLERGLDEQHRPVYGFLHQTFGEYLAGRYLANKLLADELDLGDYLHRSAWREPLLLAAGHLSANSEQAHTLVRMTLDHAEPYEHILHRGLLFAADYLADDVRVPARLRDELLRRLAELLRDPARKVREATLQRLRALANTRSREAAVQALVAVYQLETDPTAKRLQPDPALSLATALVGLQAQAHAWPIVERLLLCSKCFLMILKQIYAKQLYRS